MVLGKWAVYEEILQLILGYAILKLVIFDNFRE